jgi:hypothetical protein
MSTTKEKRESPEAIPQKALDNNNLTAAKIIISDKKPTKDLVEHESRPENLRIDKAAKLYVRIKTDYYKKSYSLTSKGDKIPELVPWKKTTIKEDHLDYYNSVFKKIERFENFANVPNNSTDPKTGYKRNIKGCYNLYEPISYKPEPGDHTHTDAFLKHIFGDKISVGLDWLTILYRNPTQNLPAIGLVSKENTTGKTTLLKWLAEIYGSNCVILGNEDLSSNFNSPWATKLIIGVDETVIEKNIVKEKVKRLVTDDKILIERKGVDKNSIPFVGKFIMLSNNEHNFIKVDQEDTRFFVCKVPTIQKKDPFMLEKLISEIPAFLAFLNTRGLFFPEKKDRLWFSPKDFETPALLNMIESSRSRTEKELLDWLERIFNVDESLQEISVSLTDLKREIAKEFKYSNLRNELERILKDNWNLKAENVQRYKSPAIEESYSVESDTRFPVLKWTNQNGRPYKISRKYVFSKLGYKPVTL